MNLVFKIITVGLLLYYQQREENQYPNNGNMIQVLLIKNIKRQFNTGFNGINLKYQNNGKLKINKNKNNYQNLIQYIYNNSYNFVIYLKQKK